MILVNHKYEDGQSRPIRSITVAVSSDHKCHDKNINYDCGHALDIPCRRRRSTRSQSPREKESKFEVFIVIKHMFTVTLPVILMITIFPHP